jgi:hypothetical protein
MSPNVQALHRASVAITGLSLVLVLLAWGTSVHARVTRIVIDIKTSPAFGGATFGDNATRRHADNPFPQYANDNLAKIKQSYAEEGGTRSNTRYGWLRTRS